MDEVFEKEAWKKEFEKAISELKKLGCFDIEPTSVKNIEDNPKFKRMELSTAQKAQMSAIVRNLPRFAKIGMISAAAENAANNDIYIMRLPKGLGKFLMKYKDGSGYGNTLLGLDNKFAMQAPLSKLELAPVLEAQKIVLQTFTAMSVVTQQYFLAKINGQLDRIKLGMDKILEFLYGDKKAELMAEVTFVKYALNNYSAIMEQDVQKLATITNLQQAKIIAMKDCEFYVSDLESTVNEKQDIVSIVKKALQIEESLSLALQVCVMSTILEVNYAQNYDTDYLKYIEDDISLYIDKTEKLIIGLFNKLQVMISNANAGIWKKVDKDELMEQVTAVLDRFKNGGESELTKTLRSGLHTAEQSSIYYITGEGDIYIRAA